MYILSGYFDFGSYVLYLTALFLIFQTVRTVDELGYEFTPVCMRFGEKKPLILPATLLWISFMAEHS